MKAFFACVGGLALLFLVIFILNIFSFSQYAFFAPKVAVVQNKVFQGSQQYNEGMIRDLENIKMEYQHSTPEQKQALRALVIHRFQVYPFEQLPPDLQNFYQSLQ